MSRYRIDYGGLSAFRATHSSDDEEGWKRWKNAFTLFLKVNGISDPIKQKDQLLHQGGPDLQSIFMNLPEDETPISAENTVYLSAVKQLDDYFMPQKCLAYERLVFRSISQGSDTFDQFLLKLRTQALKCGLRGECYEIYMIDQVIEKCASTELRRKLLDKERTLEQIIRTARAFELAQTHSKSYNKLNTEHASAAPTISSVNTKIVKCNNCGRRGHISSAQNCPARQQKCRNCSLTGHFAAVCRKKTETNHNEKRKEGHYERERPDKKQRTLSIKTLDLDNKDKKDGYLFHLEDSDNQQNFDFLMKIGGVEVKVQIDSGADANVIDETTWLRMKDAKVKVGDQSLESDIVLKGYATNKPMMILGTFTATIEIQNRAIMAKFYVVSQGKKTLIGRKTAEELGVLRIGLNVNEVSTKQPFPKIKGVQVKLSIDQSVPPVCQPYRRIPIPLEELVEKKLNELLDMDIIEAVEGPSQWVSPIVPILKSPTEVRLCLDMRMVNKAILRIHYPLPTIDDLLPKLLDAVLFSRLDVRHAFYQCELHPDSRYITTFITNKGLYRYKRLLFGISCAPERYQRILHQLLIRCEGVFNFIDDIIVFGRSREEHDERLTTVSKVLQENGILLNEEKCVYRKKELEFLGNLITGGGVKPSPRKVEALKKFREPACMEELRSFLGFVTFNSKFIPTFSDLTEPLWELTRTNEFRWTDRHRERFQK